MTSLSKVSYIPYYVGGTWEQIKNCNPLRNSVTGVITQEANGADSNMIVTNRCFLYWRLAEKLIGRFLSIRVWNYVPSIRIRYRSGILLDQKGEHFSSIMSTSLVIVTYLSLRQSSRLR